MRNKNFSFLISLTEKRKKKWKILRVLNVKHFYKNRGITTAALRVFSDLRIFAKVHFFYKLSGEWSLDSRTLDLLKYTRVEDANQLVQMALMMLPPLLLISQCIVGCSSSRKWNGNLVFPYITMWILLRKMSYCSTYKISHNQCLLPIDKEKRLTYALTFHTIVEMDASWPF